MSKALFSKTLIFTFILIFSFISPVLAYDNACIENLGDGIDNGARDQKCSDLTSYLAQAWYDADQAGGQPSEYSEWNWDKSASEIISIYDDLKGLGSFFTVAEQKDYMFPYTRDNGWLEYGDLGDYWGGRQEFLAFLNSGLTNINWAAVTAVTLLENPGAGYSFYPSGYVGENIIMSLEKYNYYDCLEDSNSYTESLNEMIATLKAFQGMYHGGGNFSALSGNGLNHQVFFHWNAYPIWQHRADAFYQQLLQFSQNYPEYSFIGQNLVDQSTSTCTSRNYRPVNFKINIEVTEDLSGYDGFRLRIKDGYYKNSFSPYHPLDLSQSNYQVDLPYFGGAITKENIHLDFISNKQITFSKLADTFKDLGSDNYQASFTFNSDNMFYGNIHLNLNRFSPQLEPFYLVYSSDYRSPLYQIKEDQDYQIFLPQSASIDLSRSQLITSNKDDFHLYYFRVEKIEKNPDGPNNLLNLEADLRLFHIQANLDLTFDQSYLDHYSFFYPEVICYDQYERVQEYYAHEKEKLTPQLNKTYDFYFPHQFQSRYQNCYFKLYLYKLVSGHALTLSDTIKINDDQDELILNLEKNLKNITLKGNFNFSTAEGALKEIQDIDFVLKNQPRSKTVSYFMSPYKTKNSWPYQFDFEESFLEDEKVKLYLKISYIPSTGKQPLEILLKEIPLDDIKAGKQFDLDYFYDTPVAYGDINYLTGEDPQFSLLTDCSKVFRSILFYQEKYDANYYTETPSVELDNDWLQDYSFPLTFGQTYHPYLNIFCDSNNGRNYMLNLLPNNQEQTVFVDFVGKQKKDLTFDLRTSQLSGNLKIHSHPNQTTLNNHIYLYFINKHIPLDSYNDHLYPSLEIPFSQFKNNLYDQNYSFSFVPGQYEISLLDSHNNQTYYPSENRIITITDPLQNINKDLVFDMSRGKVWGNIILKNSILNIENYKKFKLVLQNDAGGSPFTQTDYTDISSSREYPYRFEDLPLGQYTPTLLFFDQDGQATGQEVSLNKIMITESNNLVNKKLVFGHDSCQIAGGSCDWLWQHIKKDDKVYYDNLGKMDDCGSIFKSCFLPITNCSYVGNCSSYSHCQSREGESLGGLNCQGYDVCCRYPVNFGDPHISSVSYQDYKDGPLRYFRFFIRGENFTDTDQVCIKELGGRCFETETTGRDDVHLSILLKYDTLSSVVRADNLSSLTFTIYREYE